MCELLVRVGTRPDQVPTATERGDVVVVVDDGWAWSGRERGDPQWRIFALPGVAKSDVAHLLRPDYGPQVGRRPAPLLRARAYGFNLCLPELQAYLADDSCAEPIFTVSGIALSDLAVAKPALGG